MVFLEVNGDKCIECGVCSEECPHRLIETSAGIPIAKADAEEYCMDCGHCVAVCPTGALTHRSMNPSSLTPLRRELLPNYEQVEHLLRSRRSVRSYEDKPVPVRQLEKIIDVANHAPTGLNSQAVKWLVIKDRSEVKRFASMAAEYLRSMITDNPERARAINAAKWVGNWDAGVDSITWGAPHVVVAYADDARWDWEAQIALTFLDLAAYSAGLGSCWGGLFTIAARSSEPMFAALGILEGSIPLGAMMIGYSKNEFHGIPQRRKYEVLWR
ncbi:MAG: nitroreductase family protein [Candidatus Bathyarchaeia archaeon]